MSTPQLDLHGGDIKSDHDRAGRAARYKELAAFMNADPDEIGMCPVPPRIEACWSTSTHKLKLEPLC